MKAVEEAGCQLAYFPPPSGEQDDWASTWWRDNLDQSVQWCNLSWLHFCNALYVAGDRWFWCFQVCCEPSGCSSLQVSEWRCQWTFWRHDRQQWQGHHRWSFCTPCQRNTGRPHASCPPFSVVQIRWSPLQVECGNPHRTLSCCPILGKCCGWWSWEMQWSHGPWSGSSPGHAGNRPHHQGHWLLPCPMSHTATSSLSKGACRCHSSVGQV